MEHPLTIIGGLNGGSTVFFSDFLNTISTRKSGLYLRAGVKLKF